MKMTQRMSNFLLYDKNDGCVWHVHTTNKMNAFLAVACVDEHIYDVHTHGKYHKPYLEKLCQGVEPTSRKVHVMTPLSTDMAR